VVEEAREEVVEPLPRILWLARIERIAEGRFATVENALRHASHLLELIPLEFREFVQPSIGEEQFETLLTRGDFDGAARHLVARGAALHVQAEEHGARVVASISCAKLGRVICGSGPCAASAILNAWASYVLALGYLFYRGEDPGSRSAASLAATRH
jgi:hypothetical protein